MLYKKLIIVLYILSAGFFPLQCLVSNGHVEQFKNSSTNRIYSIKGRTVHPGKTEEFSQYEDAWKYSYDDYRSKTIASLVGTTVIVGKTEYKDFFYGDDGLSWIVDVDFYSRDFQPIDRSLSYVNNPDGMKQANHGNIITRLVTHYNRLCHKYEIHFEHPNNYGYTAFIMGPSGWGFAQDYERLRVEVEDSSFKMTYGSYTRSGCGG